MIRRLSRFRSTIALVSFVFFATVAATQVHAQNVSQWNGAYRCIPSAKHCRGWGGELRIASGNVWGNIAVSKNGASGTAEVIYCR